MGNGMIFVSAQIRSAILRGAMLIICGGIFSINSFAADYLGADAALARVMEGKTTTTVSVKPVAESDKLEEEILTFAARKRELPAAEAAQGWVVLYDRFWTLPEDQRTTSLYAHSSMYTTSGVTPLSISKLFEALPGPAAWGEIEKIAMQRGVGEKPYANEALRMTALFLTGNREGVRKELAEFEARLKGADAEAHVEKLKRSRNWGDTWKIWGEHRRTWRPDLKSCWRLTRRRGATR